MLNKQKICIYAKKTKIQRELKDSGIEANPGAERNISSLFSSLVLPTVVGMDTEDRDTLSTKRKSKNKTGEPNLDHVLPACTPLIDMFGQSYLLYHLHCRIGADCCLTSTLLRVL